MSDVLIQSLASNLFWIVVLVFISVLFRQELRNLLNSLGSFKIAGASFEMKDSRSTIESYIVLTNIFVELLSERDNAKKIQDLLSDVSVRQLAKFALKYSKEVPDDAREVELLKNIAIIVGRRGSTHEALTFLNALIKNRPHDTDILNLKANLLFDSGDQMKQIEAEQIRDRIVIDRPRNDGYRFNRALSKAYLRKDAEALADLEQLVESDYWRHRGDMLDVREFKPLEARCPDFEVLRQKLLARKTLYAKA